MKKIIVTTTINEPTEAIRRFDALQDFELVVIGDKKTPSYQLERGRYVGWEEQQARFPRLSELIGWNCIQRRNIGFLIALEMGAEIVATVDDDNIPKENWGSQVLVGSEVDVDVYGANTLAFDPLCVTNYPHLWHRGFPIQEVSKRKYFKEKTEKRKVAIQAELWDGDPDIDAACRMIFKPDCRFTHQGPGFTSDVIAPFNSQNTFLAAELVPYYFMFPEVGRMDDIWGAYYLQARLGVRPIFFPASVTQDRNVHDLTRDFMGEIKGYESNVPLLKDLSTDHRLIAKYLSGRSLEAFNEYTGIALRILSER